MVLSAVFGCSSAEPQLPLTGMELAAKLAFLEARATLGSLIHEVRRHVQIRQDVELALDNAQRRRNLLIHHFVRERAHCFLSDSGREEIIRELVSIANDLAKADREVIAVYQPRAAMLGVTDQMLADEWTRLEIQADSIARRRETSHFDQRSPAFHARTPHLNVYAA